MGSPGDPDRNRSPSNAPKGSRKPAPPQGGGVRTIAKNSLWLMVDSLVGMASQFYASILVSEFLAPYNLGGILRRLAIMHRNIRALFRQTQRHRPPKPLPCAGDQRHFCCQFPAHGFTR